MDVGETQEVPSMLEKKLAIDGFWGHSVVSKDTASKKLSMLQQMATPMHI